MWMSFLKSFRVGNTVNRSKCIQNAAVWCILYSRNIIHSCLDQVTWKNMQTKQATHERFQNAQRKKSNAKVFSLYNGIIQPHSKERLSLNLNTLPT